MTNYNEQKELAKQDRLSYLKVSRKLEAERAREYDDPSINLQMFNQKDSSKLAEIAKVFNFSNTMGIVEEVKRYEEIADFFAKKSSRDRFNAINNKYLEEMKDRLQVIQGQILTEDISKLCSKLLKRFKNGII